VCDNGRFHTTQAVTAWLEAHTDQIEVYWLDFPTNGERGVKGYAARSYSSGDR
jgi:hypothetical protein